MNKDKRIPDITATKALLGKYFDASISPLEMDRLERMAGEVAGGKAICPDPDAANALRMIYTVSRYAETALNEFADSLPEGLESRLESHISMLAAKSESRRRRPWAARLVRFSTAAAAALLIGTAAYTYLSSDRIPELPTVLIADVSKTGNGDSPGAVAYQGTMMKPIPSQKRTLITGASAATTGNTSEQPTHSIAGAGKSGNISMQKNDNPATSENERHLLEEADEALSSLPPITKDIITISEEAFRVIPTGVTAYVETSRILAQPISTLSQSINNIYESVEAVSEALSGVSTAFEAVNSSLALLADPI